MLSSKSLNSLNSHDQIQANGQDQFSIYNQTSKIFKFKCTNSATVADTLKRRGWVGVNANDNDSDDWDIYFCDLNQFRDVFSVTARSLADHQRVSHFKNSFEISRKNLMVKNLKRLRYKIEQGFGRPEAESCNFYPTTFILPAEQPMFLNEYRCCPGSLWIIKPAAGAQGKGIYIFQKLKDYFDWRRKSELSDSFPLVSVSKPGGHLKNWRIDSGAGRSKSEAQVETPKSDSSAITKTVETSKTEIWGGKNEIFVVQRYVMNPYLIGGKKFDIRFYVLVTSYSPLIAWVYREGFARFTGGQFSLQSLHDMFLHLTNVAVQRLSEDYNAQQGSKWSLQSLREYLTSCHGQEVVNNLMSNIDNIIIRTLQSVQHQIIQDRHCFEIYGFDVLIDDNVRPWLLEVNASPAFTPSNEEDYRLKCALIDDTVHVLDLEKRLTGLEKRIGGYDLIWKDGPVYANPEDSCHANEGKDGAKLNSFLGCHNDRHNQLREILANAKLIFELQKSYTMENSEQPTYTFSNDLFENKLYCVRSPSKDALINDKRFRLPKQVTVHHPGPQGTGLNLDILTSSATTATRKSAHSMIRLKLPGVNKFLATEGKPVGFRKNMLDFIKYLDRNK